MEEGGGGYVGCVVRIMAILSNTKTFSDSPTENSSYIHIDYYEKFFTVNILVCYFTVNIATRFVTHTHNTVSLSCLSIQIQHREGNTVYSVALYIQETRRYICTVVVFLANASIG